MFDPERYPIEISEMRSVQRDLKSILTDDERHNLIDWLAMNPDAGDIIAGTNGVRKARWQYGAKGKRGGIRIIYYFRDLNMPVYIIAVYKKNEKMNITMSEKKEIRTLVDHIVNEWALKRESAISSNVSQNV